MNCFRKTNPFQNLACLLVWLFVFQNNISAQDTWDWDAGEIREVKLKTVKFRVYLSPETKFVRGVIVLIPGTHGDGRGMSALPEWRELADKHHFAVMGCQFSEGDMVLYQDDKNFSTCRSIEAAAKKLAELSRHPEMANAPLAFWGHSAGSNLSARFCRFNPRRVIAFASSKGTRGPTRDKRGTEGIPMLFAVGAKDNPIWVKNSLRNIKSGISKGAPWTLALQPNEGHELGGSLQLCRIYFNAIIARQMGAAKESGNEKVRMKRPRRDDAWLGDSETREIAAYREFKSSKKAAAYLPDEIVAKAWKKYLSSE